MKNKLIFLSLIVSIFFTGCKKDKTDEPIDTPAPSNTGWNGTDNPNTIPTSVTSNNTFNSGTLPAQVDLLSHFPPIGDQGQYGTCVAWAAAYNLKTALDAIDKGLNQSQLSQAGNQYSPKDLFWSIDDSKKGADCNGTNFTDALDEVLTRGVATLQTVPYTSMGNCAQSGVQSNWTTEANGHKIKNYRKIDASVTDVKQQLANNIPVVIGAKLSDAFMTWNSNTVMTANTTYNNTGIHAYHALIISGYDDGKGPNGAFRVVNSWSNQWGDAGYIWIDYNFMISEFSFGGNFYVATNDNGNNPPPPNPNTNGVDLAPWVFGDYTTYNQTQTMYYNERAIFFNLYNIGNASATSSSDWSLYYIYYNAYDANDYGVLFYDEFNQSIPVNTYDCPGANHCILNIDIPAGNNLGNVAFGSDTLYQIYYTPTNLNGYYYLVALADAYDAFQESNEMNNVFYTTDQYPKLFTNGYSSRKPANSPSSGLFYDYKFENLLNPTPANLKNCKHYTAVTERNPNAYSSDEILGMLKEKKKNGELAQKLAAFNASKTQTRIGHK